jgi:hypothetical protein
LSGPNWEKWNPYGVFETERIEFRELDAWVVGMQ